MNNNYKDLLDGTITSLDAFRGIAFVGGFSYADVLGSAKGKVLFLKK
jgi:phosphoribosylformylglycinamidine synthase